MTFRPAYDPRTGRKLPFHVPAELFDDPVWGKYYNATPRSKASRKTSTKTAPASGDNKKKGVNPDA